MGFSAPPAASLDVANTSNALIISDLHLGWAVCHDIHRALLDHLPEALGEAELVVLNGDIIDAHRGVQSQRERDLVARWLDLVAGWQKGGRRVVYVEGNHDAFPDQPAPAHPDTWRFDFVGAHGERIRAIHGHKFSEQTFDEGLYEGLGKHLLHAENGIYARSRCARKFYGLVPGYVAGAVGLAEDTLWRRRFPARVRHLLADCDVLLHGHFHFGPGSGNIDGVPTWRTGAWVSRGHLGTKDRMLRYDRGTFTRLTLERGRFVAVSDGS